RVWVHPTKAPSDNRFPFDEAISLVADDMDWGDRSSLLGAVLVDKRELDQFKELADSLISLIEKIGPQGTFADASQIPEWQQVRASARRLHRTLVKSDEPERGVRGGIVDR